MADIVNSKLLEQLPAETKTYKSIETIPDPDKAVNFPIEILNTSQTSGIPPNS